MAIQAKSVSKIKLEQWLFMRCMSQLMNYVYGTDWTYLNSSYKKVELRCGDFHRPDRKGHMSQSQHYDRSAGDVILDVNNEYIEDSFHPIYLKMGEFWEKLDPRCRWGGRFRPADGNHFSITDGTYS
jgi:hypothetical protein